MVKLFKVNRPASNENVFGQVRMKKDRHELNHSIIPLELFSSHFHFRHSLGILEWMEKSKTGESKTASQVPCHVTSNVKDGEPEMYDQKSISSHFLICICETSRNGTQRASRHHQYPNHLTFCLLNFQQRDFVAASCYYAIDAETTDREYRWHVLEGCQNCCFPSDRM